MTIYSFSNFEPVRCSMSHSNCCFLTLIQVTKKTGKVVWYSISLRIDRVLCQKKVGDSLYYILHLEGANALQIIKYLSNTIT